MNLKYKMGERPFEDKKIEIMHNNTYTTRIYITLSVCKLTCEVKQNKHMYNLSGVLKVAQIVLCLL
jgi:hypothetical protein